MTLFGVFIWVLSSLILVQYFAARLAFDVDKKSSFFLSLRLRGVSASTLPLVDVDGFALVRDGEDRSMLPSPESFVSSEVGADVEVSGAGMSGRVKVSSHMPVNA